MIRASLYGRLGGDPVERTTSNGNTMVTASLAVDVARYGSGDEDSEWFSVAAFGTVGEALKRHQKGDLIAVMGQVSRRRYVARDGTPREAWQVTADSIVSARTVRPGGGRKREAS
ncbi:MAG: single-stranded DNA-binding protein [Alphaproteobacteria bacterium]